MARKNRARKRALKRQRDRERAQQTTTRAASNTSKKNTKKESKKNRLPKKANKAYNKLSKELAKAGKIAEDSFDISDLSRVDASRAPEVANVLAQNQALSDPFSQAYAGRRSGQLQDYVSRLQDNTQGYNSRELEALREQRRRQIDRGFQSGKAALIQGQGNARLGSTQRTAQLAQLSRNYGQSSADAENDLFVQGADEKRRALTQYGDTVRGLESDEFGRGQQALSNYSALLNQARADELERQKINLGQEAADRAAQNSAKLGILGIREARQKAKQQNKLIREGYASNERIAGASAPAASSGGGGGGYAEALAKLAEEYRA